MGALEAGRQREAARHAVRQAAREALAAVLGVRPDDISIVSSPGEPPRVLLADRPSAIGCSFSHDGDHSLVAINLQGPIGADIMHVQDIPDWQAVARDYLGPVASAALQATPATERPTAFTRMWTQREAALKCMGQQLSEWRADIPGQTIALALPVPGLAGHLHTGDKNA
ncbi:4'-phosphopantetheinyl transferase family protein [Duganella guangzhouensis]|uniref:4'-phosphopantetheinyl transferase family protein n=1 Tax=Duganella guangzhouensis TaxID=2666084 RepID=UPI003530904A